MKLNTKSKGPKIILRKDERACLEKARTYLSDLAEHGGSGIAGPADSASVLIDQVLATLNGREPPVDTSLTSLKTSDLSKVNAELLEAAAT